MDQVQVTQDDGIKSLSNNSSTFEHTHLSTQINTKKMAAFRQEEGPKSSNKLWKTRGQILDWLTIVCDKLNQSAQTYFIATEITDKVIEAFNFEISNDDLHLIVIASLFIASKFEEVVPIRFKTLCKKVGHQKYSEEDIRSAEILILKKLGFKIPRPNYVEVIHQIIIDKQGKDDAKFSNKSASKISNESQILFQNQVFTKAINIAKLITIDGQYQSKLKKKTFLVSIAYLAMKMIADSQGALENLAIFEERFITLKDGMSKAVKISTGLETFIKEISICNYFIF